MLITALLGGLFALFRTNSVSGREIAALNAQTANTWKMASDNVIVAARLDTKVSELQRRLIGLEGQSAQRREEQAAAVPLPINSVKKQATLLADEIDDFLKTRRVGEVEIIQSPIRPDEVGSMFAWGERREHELVAYREQTTQMFVSMFGKACIVVAQEFEARSINAPGMNLSTVCSNPRDMVGLINITASLRAGAQLLPD